MLFDDSSSHPIIPDRRQVSSVKYHQLASLCISIPEQNDLSLCIYTGMPQLPNLAVVKSVPLAKVVPGVPQPIFQNVSNRTPPLSNHGGDVGRYI